MNFFLKITIISFLLLLKLQSKELQKVSLQLDWLHQFQFAGYYIAKEKGFYEDFQLDVEIKEFDFNVDLINDVLNSENQYAVGKSSLIIDRLEGKKVVLLAAIYQQSPMVLISLKNSNINSPSELKNKKVMLTADARSTASINSMIISQGLKLSEINFQPHSFKLEDLINGKTDAMGCYLSNEPFILKNKNIDFVIHNPKDYGFDFFGGLLFTSENELKSHPDRVRKMYKATIKGWQYAFNNIEETAELIFNKYNTQNKTLDSLIYEGEILKKLAKFDEGLLGNIDHKKIEEIKRLYLLLSLVKNNSSLRIEDYIYDQNKMVYSIKENEYLKNSKATLLTNDSFPPLTMKTSQGLAGIEIDYWKLINEKLKIKNIDIEVVDTVKESIKKIKDNPDYVKYSFSKYDNSKELVSTNTIANLKIGIATYNDKEYISDINELKNKKVAISRSSSIFTKLRKKYPKIDFVKVKNINEALILLSDKEVYAAIGKIPVLSYQITKNNFTNLKISGTLDEKFQIKLIVNSENEILLNLLNEAISMITQEERNKIYNKYYSIVYQTSIDYSWLYKIIAPLIIIIIFVIISNRKLNQEVKKRKKIENELHIVANIDSLTNAYNRRKLEAIFSSELTRIKRYNRDLSIIFFDLDNFKLINDQLGHSVGDEVLIKLATVIKNNIRSIDYFGRWGGEEFVIILPETNKQKAANVAYILKEKIANTDFNIDRQITCSFGVSQFEETDSADSLLTRADDAMYYVKRNGKNDVKVA